MLIKRGVIFSNVFKMADKSAGRDFLRTIEHSNTIINTRIYCATKEKPFESNIGSPQGDSLSPVLFSIYLENALKEVRTILPRPTSDFEKTLPTEIAYADDVDFIGLEFAI